MILTDVEKARLNHGKINGKALDSMSIAEAKRNLAEGHFSEGRMKSKGLVCIRFLESGVEKAIITSW